MKQSSSCGFTLVELLLVVALIGGLAAFVVINSSLFRSKASGVEAQALFQIAELALEQYHVACEQYPPQVGAGESLPYGASDRCVAGVTLADFVAQSERNQLENILYFPIARDVDETDCLGYHLALELADEEDEALGSDADAVTTSLPAGFVACVSDSSSPSGISGTDPLLDIVHPSALESVL